VLLVVPPLWMNSPALSSVLSSSQVQARARPFGRTRC
jgi:hypothetical protein